MLYRTALQRQIEQLEEELVDFERGRIRVTRRTDGNVSWEDATHEKLQRTSGRLAALREVLGMLPQDL